ncbi:MAG: hypothetical protein U5K35_05745 [Rhodohalobacter sp.]|nr:hypothetical protein [Rhodohalobacter sp.]
MELIPHLDPTEIEHLGNLLKIPFQEYRPPTDAKLSDTADLKVEKLGKNRR